jgi:urease accessory protein
MDRTERAVELAPYLDQPAQLPAGIPGKTGVLRMRFARREDRTVLRDLFRQAPLLVQRALYWDEEMPDMACVFILTTSGGVLQGDRLRIDIRLDAGARAHVTSQSATKIQEMDANYGSLVQEISLGSGSYLEYLPEPTIPYRHSRYLTRTRITLPSDATLLYSETLLPGRKYHHDGELFAYDLFSSSLRAGRPGGPDLLAEKWVLDPARFAVNRCGVLDRFHVFANVLLLTPPDLAQRVPERIAPVWIDEPPLAAGMSRLPNDAGLVYRVLGMETEPVRALVRKFCAVARQETVGCATPPGFAWR